MHDVRYDHDAAGLDTAPITAEDELGALGELTTGRAEPTPGRRPNRHLLTRMMGRLGHVPEHEAARPGGSWLGRSAALLVGVFVIGTAFIASYVGALHEPHPRAIPIAVTGTDTGAQALLTPPGPFAVTSYVDADAAGRALAGRQVYAVLDTDPVNDGLRLTLAGAAAPGAADLIRQTVAGMAEGARVPLTVRDTHPVAPHDPRALTPFYLVVGWLLGGYLAATALAVIVGTVPRSGSRVGMRLAAFAVFAALLGLAGAGLMRWYQIWPANLGALWLAGTLIVFSGAALTAALESWVGLVGTGLAMLVLFILGNPASGGVYPPEFLPGPYRALHTWLPTGQATELVRGIEYFGGHALTRPVAGLAAWSLLGLAAIVGATLALGHRSATPAG